MSWPVQKQHCFAYINDFLQVTLGHLLTTTPILYMAYYVTLSLSIMLTYVRGISSAYTYS